MTKGQWLFGGVFVTASAVLLGAFAAAMTDSAHRDDVHEHEIDAGAPRDLAELLTWAPVVVIATLETERTTTTDLRSSTDGNVHGRRREYVRTFSVERVLKTDRAFGPEITVRAGITSSSWEDRESDAQTSDLLAPRLKKGSRYLLFLAVFDPENTGADLGHAGPLATAGLKGDVATFLVPPRYCDGPTAGIRFEALDRRPDRSLDCIASGTPAREPACRWRRRGGLRQACNRPDREVAVGQGARRR